MPRGGARHGAGRPRGTRVERLIERESELASEGMTPLEFLLMAIRDPDVPFASRLDAAKAAVQFCHPRMAANQPDNRGATHEQALAVLE